MSIFLFHTIHQIRYIMIQIAACGPSSNICRIPLAGKLLHSRLVTMDVKFLIMLIAFTWLSKTLLSRCYLATPLQWYTNGQFTTLCPKNVFKNLENCLLSRSYIFGDFRNCFLVSHCGALIQKYCVSKMFNIDHVMDSA